MTTTLSVLLFGGAGLALIWVLVGGKEAVADGGNGGGNGTTSLRDIELEPGALERLFYPMLVSMGAAIARMLPPGRLAKLRQRIILAGKQLTWNVERAMAYKSLGLIVGTALAVLLLWQEQSGRSMFGAVLLVGIGWFYVDFRLDRIAGARQLGIQQALPDVLDQISVCVEAGLGFDAAMHRVADGNENVLADELGRTLSDVRLGMPRAQALHALLDRTDVQDLRLFVRAIIQAEKSGIPMSRILQVQSDEVREKRRQAAEERAMKLPVKLVMPLVLCILPALFTVIMGPAVLRMIREGAI